MDILSNRSYLKNDQYRTPDKLLARIGLHQAYSRNSEKWLDWVFKQLPLEKNSCVLDIGCGDGSLWRDRAAIPAEFRLFMADLSMGMIQKTKTNTGSHKSIKGWTAADAQMLPFQSGAFNLVIANHMLFHVPDLTMTIQEIIRVLKQSGILCATTIGSRHLEELHQMIYDVSSNYPFSTHNAQKFGLENAQAILSPYFSKISVTIQEDWLDIPDAEPLMQYIRSMVDSAKWLSPQVETRIREMIEEQISLKGCFSIRKASGLVTAML